MNSKLLTSAASILALAFFLCVHNVYAQSFLEKSLVAKSKLHNPVWLKHDPQSTTEVDHDPWDVFLNQNTSLNSNDVRVVAYSSVSDQDRKSLEAYLIYLQSVDVARLNRNEQYAFWLNLYNASIVSVVLDNLPLDSILDIKSNPLDLKGPFNDPVAVIYGQKLTPDDIESGIVRPIWRDPLLHYGFNCAAVACPNLYPEAFRGPKLKAQLNKAARSFINDPRGVRFESGKLIASKIFFWYSEDYGDTEAGILNHIRQFAEPALAAVLLETVRIDRYEYDWDLNGN